MSKAGDDRDREQLQSMAGKKPNGIQMIKAAAFG